MKKNIYNKILGKIIKKTLKTAKNLFFFFDKYDIILYIRVGEKNGEFSFVNYEFCRYYDWAFSIRFWNRNWYSRI